jgi:hypothetical protein
MYELHTQIMPNGAWSVEKITSARSAERKWEAAREDIMSSRCWAARLEAVSAEASEVLQNMSFDQSVAIWSPPCDQDQIPSPESTQS